jgi:hypothetical protein
MELADEIRRLKELHDEGALTDDEFSQAKAALLEGVTGDSASTPRGQGRSDDGLGVAAKRWVNLQIVLVIAGFVLALVFFFAFFLPDWRKTRDEFDRRWSEFPSNPPSHCSLRRSSDEPHRRSQQVAAADECRRASAERSTIGWCSRVSVNMMQPQRFGSDVHRAGVRPPERLAPSSYGSGPRDVSTSAWRRERHGEPRVHGRPCVRPVLRGGTRPAGGHARAPAPADSHASAG